MIGWPAKYELVGFSFDNTLRIQHPQERLSPQIASDVNQNGLGRWSGLQACIVSGYFWGVDLGKSEICEDALTQETLSQGPERVSDVTDLLIAGPVTYTFMDSEIS